MFPLSASAASNSLSHSAPPSPSPTLPIEESLKRSYSLPRSEISAQQDILQDQSAISLPAEPPLPCPTSQEPVATFQDILVSMPFRSVFIARLPQHVPHARLRFELHSEISKIAAVQSVNLRLDRRNQIVGFAELEDAIGAALVLKHADKLSVLGQNIRIEPVRVKRTLCLSSLGGTTKEDVENAVLKLSNSAIMNFLSSRDISGILPQFEGKGSVIMVRFGDYYEAESAIQELARQFPGVEVNWAPNAANLAKSLTEEFLPIPPVQPVTNGEPLSTSPGVISGESGSGTSFHRNGRGEVDQYSIFVGHLNPRRINTDALRERFGKYGEIVDLSLINKHTDIPAFAFVRFRKLESAGQAIRFEHNSPWLDKFIRVEYRIVLREQQQPEPFQHQRMRHATSGSASSPIPAFQMPYRIQQPKIAPLSHSGSAHTSFERQEVQPVDEPKQSSRSRRGNRGPKSAPSEKKGLANVISHSANEMTSSDSSTAAGSSAASWAPQVPLRRRQTTLVQGATFQAGAPQLIRTHIGDPAAVATSTSETATISATFPSEIGSLSADTANGDDVKEEGGDAQFEADVGNVAIPQLSASSQSPHDVTAPTAQQDQQSLQHPAVPASSIHPHHRAPPHLAHLPISYATTHPLPPVVTFHPSSFAIPAPFSTLPAGMYSNILPQQQALPALPIFFPPPPQQMAAMYPPPHQGRRFRPRSTNSSSSQQRQFNLQEEREPDLESAIQGPYFPGSYVMVLPYPAQGTDVPFVGNLADGCAEGNAFPISMEGVGGTWFALDPTSGAYLPVCQVPSMPVVTRMPEGSFEVTEPNADLVM
ncbi:hypothetical protein BJ742DRAFT_794744 [Cladochytrium replicatum]|nr:hypothetical protein BJ742DRAFT_794744 [Cladochytrium replicatum]